MPPPPALSYSRCEMFFSHTFSIHGRSDSEGPQLHATVPSRPAASSEEFSALLLASLGFCKQNENGAAAKTADLATYNAALSAALRLAEGPWERSIQKGS